MTTSAAALPVLAKGADNDTIIQRVNVLIRWFNRPDLCIPSYASDSGTGAAYVIAPSSDIKVYEVGQIYEFQAAHANTISNPTLAVQGLTAGVITRINGAALALGDIPVGPVAVICTDATTPKFALLTPYSNGGATTYLGSDVALSNTANFFAGPNTGSIGANGQTWLLIATAQFKDTVASANFALQIHDGTNGIAAQTATTNGVNLTPAMVIATPTLTGPTTFTAQGRDLTSANGVMMTSSLGGVANKATAIMAMRIA